MLYFSYINYLPFFKAFFCLTELGCVGFSFLLSFRLVLLLKTGLFLSPSIGKSLKVSKKLLISFWAYRFLGFEIASEVKLLILSPSFFVCWWLINFLVRLLDGNSEYYDHKQSSYFSFNNIKNNLVPRFWIGYGSSTESSVSSGFIHDKVIKFYPDHQPTIMSFSLITFMISL